jgi:hypothetical protein
MVIALSRHRPDSVDDDRDTHVMLGHCAAADAVVLLERSIAAPEGLW